MEWIEVNIMQTMQTMMKILWGNTVPQLYVNSEKVSEGGRTSEDCSMVLIQHILNIHATTQPEPGCSTCKTIQL